MMAHEEPLSPGDVVAYYRELREQGGRPFLLRRSAALAGDADLRRVAGEFAILR